ncbi:hypothetical protein RhiJN_23716 [Ceratobasidium sp. AG-Ba]|nr:hypothetical protein RhiJN_23716 [Ceratobasidium sp. AG-Ba]
MTLITLLVAIALTAIMLSLPGLVPYVHAFVGVTKYPAYAYFTCVRVARLSQVWQSGRRLITPRSLFSAGLALLFWLLKTIVTRTSLLVVSRILAGRWHKFVTLLFSMRLSLRAHFRQYLVEPCSLLASSFWTCALTHVMTCVMIYGFDVTMPASVWPTISRYPLSFFVGLLSLIIMWRCALKTIVLGVLGVDVVTYAYLSVISSLARMLLSLRLEDWVVLVVSLKYVFDVNNIPRHEVAQPLVFIIFYWTRVTRVMGCVLAATITIELFAAIVVPLYRLYSLLHLQYKPSNDVTSVIERPTPPFQPRSPPSVPSETGLSTLPTSPSPSCSATSGGVGRLARFINAYLGDSVSSESVVELENRFGNTRSIRAPPATQTASPPTPLLSVPTTPAPGSPVLPVNPTLTPTLTPDLTFESGDEDEEVASLATRLSESHIELESDSAPQGVQVRTYVGDSIQGSGWMEHASKQGDHRRVDRSSGRTERRGYRRTEGASTTPT